MAALTVRAVRKIIWAVDAFESVGPLHRHAVRLLKALNKKTNAKIEPVYVLSAAQLNITPGAANLWLKYYKPAAEAAVKKIAKVLRLPNLSQPHVLIQRSSSTVEAVDLLVKHAEYVNADLVVASTHGRGGMSRLFLGSFSETLLTRSSVPVAVVGLQMRPLRNVKHLLFPTEFGEHSQGAFRRAVQVAKSFGAKITLFHSVPHPVEPLFQSGIYLLGGSWIPIQSYFSKEIERQNRHAQAWCRWATQQGVEVEPYLEIQGGDVSDLILKAAEERDVNLIVMESQSGPIAAMLIGSVTRQVIRHSHCPVWVLPGHLPKAERLPEFSTRVA